jgi:hypothetical protein
VFSGEVVEVDKSPPPDKEVRFNPDYGDTALVTLQVSDVWMGPEQETLEVSTPVFGASCGYPFKEGQEYLVYAYGGKDLKVVLCSETKELSRAGADLTLLANSEKPKDGSNDEEALSDTSGGVSARVIAGMAGLAMAASLLVVVRLVRTG